MNERHRAFADAYLANGGNAKAAAVSAGYKDSTSGNAKVVGYRLLKKPEIEAYIVEAMKRQCVTHGPLALRILTDLAQNAAQESTKLAAARDLADRAGLRPVEKQEVKITDERTDEELEASIAAAIAEAYNGRVHH